MTTATPPEDDALAATFAEAARARRPSRFETARAARDLEGALDRLEERRRRALRPAVAAAAVVLAGSVGVVLGVALGSPAQPPVTAAVHPVPAVAVASSVVPVAAVPSVPEVPAAPSVAPALEASVPAPALRPPRRPHLGWREAVGALREAGELDGAARALAAALRTDDAAGGPLLVALRQAPSAFADVDGALASVQRAEPMRVRCEAGLLYRRDRATLEACRSFAQQWPEHPGARVLAFAAGRLAEDELGDLEAAEAEFGRAILLAPLAGLPSTDALLARARVRASLGVLDEARSDLRLYLHQEPAAAAEPSVRALMERLELDAAPRSGGQLR